MRTLLFFDLPSVTSTDLKHYRGFIKLLKTNGFYMIQESVYVKMSLDSQAASATVSKISSSLPPNGSVMVLTITEKQFSSMNILLGDNKTDVLSNNDRMVIL